MSHRPSIVSAQQLASPLRKGGEGGYLGLQSFVQLILTGFKAGTSLFFLLIRKGRPRCSGTGLLLTAQG